MSVALGNIDFLTILSLSILEYGMCFHLLMFSQVSFRNVLLLLLYRSFTSLVKLIPRYFILFDAILNETVFLISFSDGSLLVYRNETDFFCVDFVSCYFAELFY